MVDLPAGILGVQESLEDEDIEIRPDGRPDEESENSGMEQIASRMFVRDARLPDEVMPHEAVYEWPDDTRPANIGRKTREAVTEEIWSNLHKLRMDWFVQDDDRRRIITKELEEQMEEGFRQYWTGDKFISDLSIPARWLRHQDWGMHCSPCQAWWMGSVKVALESRQLFPDLGMKCWVCIRYAEQWPR